jgi:hypothetical protein
VLLAMEWARTNKNRGFSRFLAANRCTARYMLSQYFGAGLWLVVGDQFLNWGGGSCFCSASLWWG